MFIKVVVNGETLDSNDATGIAEMMLTEDRFGKTVAETLLEEDIMLPISTDDLTEGEDIFGNLQSFIVACYYADEDFKILEMEGISSEEVDGLQFLIDFLSKGDVIEVEVEE